MKRDLSVKFAELMQLADRICVMLGLPLPDRAEIYEQYYAEVPQPVNYDNGRTQVWIDRYYLAYQIGAEDVHYVYVTRTHIGEELSSRIRLPEDILSAFREALSCMNRKHCNIWLEEDRVAYKKGA